MTLPLIIYRSLRQHALSTLVTAFNMALACGLLMAVWMLHAQAEHNPGIAGNFFLDGINRCESILALVTVIVVLVATGTVLASIYASMSARQRDIAILRALGAKRRVVFRAVVLEAMVIGALGAVCGFVVYAVLMGVVCEIVREQTGAVISVFAWGWILLWAPLGMVALGALGGIVPAVKAYRVPVAQTLSPLS